MTAPSLDNTVAQSPAIDAFWANFCRATAIPVETPYQAWYFGADAAGAHALVELVLHGPKRATAGLAATFDRHPHAAPVADGYSIVTEFDGTPRAVIRTTALETRAFGAVDATFAWDEGEGDRTLDDWRAGHRAFFGRECAAIGVPLTDTTPIVLERFELLYPFAQALGCVEPYVLRGYLPGSLADSASLQSNYYARHHGFGAAFEAGRLRDIGDFLARYDPRRDGVWLVAHAGAVRASIVIDGGDGTGIGHLRWFIVDDSLRGRGFGKRLMDAAMTFCRARYSVVYLTTFAGLDAARHLYETHGFKLVDERSGQTWGKTVIEQRFEWRAAD